MKRLMIVLFAAMFLITGCAQKGISKEEYEKVVEERDSYKEQLEALRQGLTGEENDSKDTQEKENNSSSIKLTETELNKEISVKEYYYVNDGWGTYYFMEVTNNSELTVSVQTNIIAKDKDGKTVGAESNSEDAIAPGYSVCLFNIFDSEEINSYEYTITAKEDKYYSSVQQDLSYEVSDIGNGIIITCTNNGEKAANFVEGTVVFFSGENAVGYESQYFTDDDSELKPGNTLAKQFDYYGDRKYDSYKVYFTGRR